MNDAQVLGQRGRYSPPRLSPAAQVGSLCNVEVPAMGHLHNALISRGQLELGLDATSKEERRRIAIAAAILADDELRCAFTHPGLCLTILPYRRTPDGMVWIRERGDISLTVQPLVSENGQLTGVPYGSKARIILLYLQSEAIRTGSRVIELGRSMQHWLSRMGLSKGGKSYRQVEEQAERIGRCVLTFTYKTTEGRIRWQDSIIRGSFNLFDRSESKLHKYCTVELSETFYEALSRHPVPVSERAIQILGERCAALDLYLWLCYRLHALSHPIDVPWGALFAQFGACTQSIKHFKPRFARDIEVALAPMPFS
jgi:hypothetical protein